MCKHVDEVFLIFLIINTEVNVFAGHPSAHLSFLCILVSDVVDIFHSTAGNNHDDGGLLVLLSHLGSLTRRLLAHGGKAFTGWTDGVTHLGCRGDA